MEKNPLTYIAIALALLSYFAFAKPITIVRLMHAWQSLWAKLFGSNVLTYEQSSRIELARNDAAEYERKHYTQITIVRWVGFISILVVIALICMIFN